MNNHNKKQTECRTIFSCCYDFITGHFHSRIKVLIIYRLLFTGYRFYSRFLQNNCGIDAAKTRVGNQDIAAFKISRL